MKLKALKTHILLYITNLSVRRQLRLNTVMILILVCITAITGLFNQLNMNSRLLSFYQDSYTIHTKSLYTKNALLTIENYMYRAIASDKENLKLKYINQSENAYTELETMITAICNSSKSLKSLSNKDQQELQLEVQKLKRYRERIASANKIGNINEVFSTYKNDYIPILTTITATLDTIITKADQYARQYIYISKNQTLLTAIIYILLSILAALLSIYLSKKTSNQILFPIHEIDDCMSNMSKGDLKSPILYTSSNELGHVCDATRIMQTKLQAYITNITYILNELENRNLTIEPNEEYIGDFLPIKNSLQSIIKFYNLSIHQIYNSCEKVTELSKQVNQDSTTIQAGAKDQTSTLSTLTDHIMHIEEYALSNTSLATQLQDIFLAMSTQMNEADLNMQKLMKLVETITEQSNGVTNIIKILETISNNTQLVSLNASIEAVHSDLTGNTFVVVANEMSRLSKQCIETTDKIKPLIKTTITSIDQCYESAKITRQSLDYTVKFSNILNKLVNNILSASSMQHELVDQITGTLPSVQDIANKNELSSAECMRSVEKNMKEIDKLTSLVSSFRI